MGSPQIQNGVGLTPVGDRPPQERQYHGVPGVPVAVPGYQGIPLGEREGVGMIGPCPDVLLNQPGFEVVVVGGHGIPYVAPHASLRIHAVQSTTDHLHQRPCDGVEATNDCSGPRVEREARRRSDGVLQDASHRT